MNKKILNYEKRKNISKNIINNLHYCYSNSYYCYIINQLNMLREDKIKRAIAIAVAYVENNQPESQSKIWGRSAVNLTITKRKFIQRRGKSI
jgi:hypothetical protein